MAENLPSTCCMLGTIHSGAPTGSEEVVHGLQTYVARPENNAIKGTVVIIGDVFGWNFVNVRLIADSYARKGGFKVLLPDFHSGGSFPSGHMDTAFPLNGIAGPPLWKRIWVGLQVYPRFVWWFWSHREAISLPIIDGFFRALREEEDGVGGKIGVAGFCWGGRYAVLMGTAKHPYADAVYSAHPSFLGVPAEVEAVIKPITFAVGTKDRVLPMHQVKQIQDVFKKKDDLDSEVVVYNDMVHSFAVRGNPEIESEKKGMENSEDQAVEWFKRYLQ